MIPALLAALLGLGSTAMAGPEPAADAPAEDAPGEDAPDDDAADDDAADDDAADDDAAPAPNVEEDVDVAGPRVLDAILPSGVRVIIAEDGTLPVASVVLAIERGSEDDPEAIPGLHHALAYQLLQGNREQPPGGIARLVHDRGGITSMATGPAQIRFESLVPVSALADLVAAEAGRLRAPTVNEELWQDSLVWARRDPAQAWGAPPPAIAAAHGVPALARNGRQVSAPLAQLDTRAVAAALADRFRYERATLVVVGPYPPIATMALVDAHFSDLPPRRRQLVDRKPRRGTGDVPAPLPTPGADGTTFVWPVDAHPAAVAWAKVWCRTFNRQRRTPADPRRARLRCHLDEDPRRPTLTVRTSGVDDPWAFVQSRIAAIADGRDARLVERELGFVRAGLEFELRTPLGLARALARSAADAPATDPDRPERAVHLLTGLHDLREPSRFPDITAVLRGGAAVRLVAPQEK
jgi:hypothetical protein